MRKYFCAYTTIYVDAFAGTGKHVESADRRCKAAATVLEDEDDSDAEALQKGSALITLEVDPPFNRFLFIGRNAKRVQELEKLRSEFPERANVILIKQGDASNVLKQGYQQTDSRRHRAVVFLDPYCMQVRWAAIEAIAAIKTID